METQTRTEVLRRLKSIEGHVAGITRMVVEERDCLAVLQQLRAVQGSLKQTSLLVLSHHLDHCLCELWGDVDDAERRQVYSELLAVVEHS
ncbi:MAG TPA: metal-sensitive transcriptional regulator [Caldilineaceae bacterium]|nr:metal-sensitive transcriptional regulator [Caldilineaceae bacterium]